MNKGSLILLAPRFIFSFNEYCIKTDFKALNSSAVLISTTLTLTVGYSCIIASHFFFASAGAKGCEADANL